MTILVGKTSSKTYKLLFITFLLLVSFGQSQGESNKEIVGIDEQLGKIADLNFTFTNSEGKKLIVADYVDKPTIINFVYYECPGICTPILNGLQRAIRKLDLIPGEDYRILTISFNKDETFDLAKQKKDTYLKGLEIPFPEAEWEWVTGDSTNIAGITNTLGFKFKKTDKDFAHSAALILLSNEGKVTRYLYGTYQNPFDIKMAVIEASEGVVVPSIAKVLKFCFSYDPAGRKYVFNFLKISATLIIITVLSIVLFFGFKGKKVKLKV